jgi:hypothetical protein
MTVLPAVDSIVVIEMLLNEIFQNVFQNEGARHHFGFLNISPVTSLDGLPHWYLWLEGKKGAYGISVQDDAKNLPVYQGSGCEMGDDQVRCPCLWIRYFPAVDEAVFDALSCHEQIIRLGTSFDKTGTPSFEGRPILDTGYFSAGRIDMTVHTSTSAVDFFCSAPNRWRIYQVDGLELTDDQGNITPLLPAGALDRDFPGWELSFFLFQKLISAFCLLSGQAPRVCGHATRAFVHYAIDRKTHIKRVSNPEMAEAVFGVSFYDSVDGSEGASNIGRWRLYEKMIGSLQYSSLTVWDSPAQIPQPLRSEEWWTIRNHHFHDHSNHVCTCYR